MMPVWPSRPISPGGGVSLGPVRDVDGSVEGGEMMVSAAGVLGGSDSK